MPFILIEILVLIPTCLVHGFALTRLIHLSRPRLFWPIWVIMHIFGAYPLRGSGLFPTILFSILLWVLIPFFSSDEKPSIKILACSLAFVVMLMAEILLSLFWILVTQSANNIESAKENLLVYLLIRIVHLLVIAALFSGFYMLWSTRIKKIRVSALFSFAVFPLTQAMLLFCIAYISFYFNFRKDVYFRVILLLLVCVLADLILFFALRQMEVKQLADERADFFQNQIEEQISHYERLTGYIEKAACFRHDLRNQLQTVYALIDHDELEAARCHLDAMTANLCENDEEETI